MDSRINNKNECFNSVVRPIKRFKSLTHCYYLGERNRKNFMYKYMDIETAIRCLKDSNIRFVEPTEWQDQYEGRFYTASYKKITQNSKDVPKLYACCFTFNNASEAAWKTYSYQKTGLAARCVQFRIRKRVFREALDKYADMHDCTIYEGAINYELDDYQINHLHFSNYEGYDKVFNSSFERRHYLSLLLLKRPAFYYENEFRYFIVPKNETVNKQIFPTIRWADIVDQIKVDSACTEIELEILTKYLKEYDIDIEPEPLNLYSNPDETIIIGDLEKR